MKFKQTLNRALLIITNTLGHENEKVANCYSSIGHIYQQTGMFNEAITNYQEALSIFESISDLDSPNAMETKAKLSEIQAKLKEQENEPKNEN